MIAFVSVFIVKILVIFWRENWFPHVFDATSCQIWRRSLAARAQNSPDGEMIRLHSASLPKRTVALRAWCEPQHWLTRAPKESSLHSISLPRPVWTRQNSVSAASYCTTFTSRDFMIPDSSDSQCSCFFSSLTHELTSFSFLFRGKSTGLNWQKNCWNYIFSA